MAASLGMVALAGLPARGLSSRKILASGGLAETLISTVAAAVAVGAARPWPWSGVAAAATGGEAPLFVTCQKTTARTAPATSAPTAKIPRLLRPLSPAVLALLAKRADCPVKEGLEALPAPMISTLSELASERLGDSPRALPGPEWVAWSMTGSASGWIEAGLARSCSSMMPLILARSASNAAVTALLMSRGWTRSPASSM